MKRRAFIGGGMAAILASRRAPAFCIALRNGMMRPSAPPTPPWSNPYVTDGLIAMWDGEWNAGGGVHDNTITEWFDLTGNNHRMYAPSPSWGANYAYCDDNAGSRFRETAAEAEWFRDVVSTGKYTVELVFTPATGGGGDALNYYIIGFGFLFSSFAYAATNTAVFLDLATSVLGGTAVNTRKVLAINGMNYLASRCAQVSCDVSSGILAFNGTEAAISGTFNVTMEKQGMALGARGNLDNYSASREMKHYRFSVYNRPLTSAELAANYAIDKARFNLP